MGVDRCGCRGVGGALERMGSLKWENKGGRPSSKGVRHREEVRLSGAFMPRVGLGTSGRIHLHPRQDSASL